MGKLSDSFIRKLTATGKVQKHQDGDGLFLLVTATGKKYWRYKFRFEGKEQLLSLGIYPAVSIAKVHIAHAEAKQLKDAGINPCAVKREKKQAEQQEQAFSKVVQLYLENAAIEHKGYKWEALRLNKIMRDFPKLANKPINLIDKSDMIEFRQKSLLKIQGTSVKREMQILGSVFRYAIRDLLILKESPLAHVDRPSENPHRDVRISADDIQVLKDAFNFTDETPIYANIHQIMWAFLFALETAMRKGEILSMQWCNVYADYVLLPDTKNGLPRKVPLNKNALALLERAKGLDSDFVLTVDSASFDTLFRRYRKKTPLEGVITFHDTRHEATTRLAQILPIQDLAKVTGHKDLAMLMRYYNPTASELAQRMNEGIDKVKQ